MRMTPVLVSFSAAAALAACSSSPGDEPPVLAGSFDVAATLTYPAGVDRYGLPDSERLVLRLDDRRTGSVAAIWGGDVGSDESTLERTGTRISLRQQVRLAVAPAEPDSFEPTIYFHTVDLELIDGDGDGEIDALEGTGSGTFIHVLGDVEFQQSFTVELRGEPDTTPPELVLDGDVDAHNVLERLRVVASEPLHPDTRVVVRHGNERILLERSPDDGGYVRSFVTRSLLPFDADLQIEVNPPAQDLAGNVATSVPGVVRTMAAPGVFARDGFEGELVAVSRGAEVVSNVGTLPAIAGARSLLVESGDAVTLRVPLTGGDSRLRFEARSLSLSAEFGCDRVGVRVGYPGLPPEQDVVATSISLPRSPSEPTGDTTWVQAGPVDTFEMTVPAGARGEVIVEFYELPLLPGPPCPGNALLIDDLRTE